MTLDEFVSLINHRIPTPAEFVSFARAQKWGFQINGTAAALTVPDAKDPFVRSFAKMLSREPYRTRVLEHLKQVGGNVGADPAALPEASHQSATPQLVICRLCSADVTDPETRERMADPAFCDRGGAKVVLDLQGKVLHPAMERCPHKPGKPRAA